MMAVEKDNDVSDEATIAIALDDVLHCQCVLTMCFERKGSKHGICATVATMQPSSWHSKTPFRASVTAVGQKFFLY